MFTIYMDGDVVYWLDANTDAASGSLADASKQANGQKVCVVIGTENVRLTKVTVPPIRKQSQQREVIRYALEEQMADDVETVHFATASARYTETSGKQQVIPVAVIAEHSMRELLAKCRDAELCVTQVIPDALALPQPDNQAWHLQIRDQRMVVRTGVTGGFACDTALWPVMAMGADNKPTRIVVDAADTAAEAADGLIDSWTEDTPPHIQMDAARPEADQIKAVLEHGAQAGTINLCQAEFNVGSGQKTWHKPLCITAALVGLLVFGVLTLRGITMYQLQSKYHAIQQHNVALFRSAFPDVSRINDLRTQAEQKMLALQGQAGGNNGAFMALQSMASVIHDVRQQDPGAIQFSRLNYRDGRMVFGLHADGVQTLDRLRDAFKAQEAVHFDVDQAQVTSNGVEVRATLEINHG